MRYFPLQVPVLHLSCLDDWAGFVHLKWGRFSSYVVATLKSYENLSWFKLDGVNDTVTENQGNFVRSELNATRYCPHMQHRLQHLRFDILNNRLLLTPADYHACVVVLIWFNLLFDEEKASFCLLLRFYFAPIHSKCYLWALYRKGKQYLNEEIHLNKEETKWNSH